MRDGWREAKLGGVAEYQNGYPFKPEDLGTAGLPVIRIKQLLDPADIPDRSLLAVNPRHLIGDGELIFSWSGTLAVRLWDRGPAILNQHLFRVIERDGIDRGWLRIALDHAIDALSVKTHGTTMKHITKAELLPHPVLVPPLAEQRRIADLVGTLDIYNARLRSALDATSAVRNGLLAELLSGEHEIPDSYDRLLDGMDD